MNFRNEVLKLLERVLEEHPKLFLIDLNVGTDRSIKIVLDGDEDVSLKDCMNVSRKIEHALDREKADFSLEVTSCGVGSPLQNLRQYPKNIGRKLEVQLQEGKPLQGKLSQTNGEAITLEWKEREPKPIGKGKRTVEKQRIIKYNEIAQARVII